MTTQPTTTDAAIAQARRFHEAYERLAPQFGYETRPETREFNPKSLNGQLMIAVCKELSTETPATAHGEQPAVGFVLSAKDNEWWWQRTDHMSPEARDMVRELLRAMQQTPTAHPSADPAPEKNFVRDWTRVIKTMGKESAQPSAKDGVRGEPHPIGWVKIDNDRCVIDFTNRQPIANGWRDNPRNIVHPVYTDPQESTTAAGLVDGVRAIITKLRERGERTKEQTFTGNADLLLANELEAAIGREESGNG